MAIMQSTDHTRHSSEFRLWMAQVDAELTCLCGLSSGDLGDICYRDMFEDGCEPREAAEECLEQNDFPMELI